MHFHEWNFCILIRISLKSVSKAPVDNTSALVQVKAWRRTGDNADPVHRCICAALGEDEITNILWAQNPISAMIFDCLCTHKNTRSSYNFAHNTMTAQLYGSLVPKSEHKEFELWAYKLKWVPENRHCWHKMSWCNVVYLMSDLLFRQQASGRYQPNVCGSLMPLLLT